MRFLMLSTDASFTYQALLVLALVLVLGLYAGRIFSRIKLPHITGYIVMGVVIGLGLVWMNLGDIVEHLNIVSSVALGFIAFGIGTELEFGKLKKSGKQVLVITIFQAVSASVVTIVGILIIGVSLPIALVLGAIATATAPAPIMLLTRQYRAKGPLTDTLLPLVGLDDAVGIILFGVLLAVADAMNTGVELTVLEMIEDPAIELAASAIVGAIIGFVAAFLIRQIKSKDSQKEEAFLAVSVFAVFMTVALAKMGVVVNGFPFHLSPILTPMVMGVVLTNNLTRVRAHDVNLSVEQFSSPILVAFFTLAGAELVIAFSQNIDVDYGSLIGITAVYIIFRIIGKLSGAYLGARVMKAHRSVQRFLGICLLPQAGVALGMAYQAKTDFGEHGITILIVVLIATLVYELFGPIGVKAALEKANEIHV